MQIMNPAEPGLTMKDQNGISDHPNGYVRTALSTELKDINEHDILTDVDDFNGSEKQAKDVVPPSGYNHTGLPHTDSSICTDKNILLSDVPELIICYKDSTFHAVKDICVDEGVPAENKCLTEDVMDGRSTLPSDTYEHEDVTKEAETDILHKDAFKSSLHKDLRTNAVVDSNKGEVDVNKDTDYDRDASGIEFALESNTYQDYASAHSPEILTHRGEEKCNAVENSTEIVCDSLHSGENRRREISLKCLLKSSRSGETDCSQWSDEISGVQGTLTTEELNRRKCVDNPLYSGELESETITLNIDSSKVAPSNTDEIDNNAIGQQLKSEDKVINDNGISGNHLVVSNHLVVNSQIKRDEGESSFSSAGPPSDLVPNSGHVPFSGSISLRSDSSTTSTRSFAFPVLPNEWNSSPVRMKKADRRQLRKNRGCSLGLLCCRF